MLLALTALGTYASWERGPASDWAGPASLVAAAGAVVAAAWAILLAPSRSGQVVGGAALLVALATIVLWWRAWSEIVKTT